MRLGVLTGLASLLAIALATGANAADTSNSGKQASDIDLLGRFDIVIGDLGDKFDGWDDRDTRVYVEVDDGRDFHQHYFDNLPAAIFVLRELYGRARITDIGVPEYAGPAHEAHGHIGHGLIDGRRAWYVWDYDHYSRGGTPLVLAFYSQRDAEDEARYRDADVLSYPELMWRLNDWADRAYDQIYWRGWDRNRWRDSNRWNAAWNARYKHGRWDHRDGWMGVDLHLGDLTIHWERDRGVFARIGGRDGDIRERHDYDRDRDRNRERDRYDRDGGRDRERNDNGRGRGHYDSNGRGHDRGRGRGHDRDDRNERERDRGNDRGNGNGRGNGNDNGRGNGNDRGNGNGHDNGNGHKRTQEK